jgi:hypothetical protein
MYLRNSALQLDPFLKKASYVAALTWIFRPILIGRIFLPNPDPQAKVTTIFSGQSPK